MRKCIVILLFCSVGMSGESLASQSKKLLVASFAAVTAAEVVDSASSWGKWESNPVFGQSRFGIEKASVKIELGAAILTGQHLLLRRRSSFTAFKAMAAINFASAGVLGGIAFHNSKIPELPK
jgi:hypothetical protein